MYRLPLFIPYYITWHYGKAFSDIFRIFSNLIWAAANFFSIKILLKTLLAPWRRLQEEKKKSGFDLEEWAGNLIVNEMMRLVGFLIRILTIAIGVTAIIVIAGLGLVVLILWFMMPLVIAGLLFLSFSTFFSQI